MKKSNSLIILIIVIAQFCCTSLWFAGNAVLDDLINTYNLPENALGNLTSSVQFGFIIGTLTFAIFTIADQFSPAKVFFTCALLGATANSFILFDFNSYTSILFFRFLTGFFLAGIYPVGMKIAADYFDKQLGKALGFLVGALVLGTAFPHLLKVFGTDFPWKNIIMTISILAIFGGILILFLGDGPHRKQSQQFNFKAFFTVFKNQKFKKAAFGYFGHMWELYTFWAFVPIILKLFFVGKTSTVFNPSLLSFTIIAIGFLGCIVGGFLSLKFDAKKIALIMLTISGLCCLVLPFAININSSIGFVVFLLIWGFTVVADSPLFSTEVAKNADIKIKGTALTIVNCIGFSITIISIQMINFLFERYNSPSIFMILALGPLFGLLYQLKKPSRI